jgi:hypothetical protein
MGEVQVSAFISEETKEKLERYAEAHGVKKAHLLEEALLHHLQALRELPADVLIPPRMVLAKASFEAAARLTKKPRVPTAALLALLAGEAVQGEP